MKRAAQQDESNEEPPLKRLNPRGRSEFTPSTKQRVQEQRAHQQERLRLRPPLGLWKLLDTADPKRRFSRSDWDKSVDPPKKRGVHHEAFPSIFRLPRRAGREEQDARDERLFFYLVEAARRLFLDVTVRYAYDKEQHRWTACFCNTTLATDNGCRPLPELTRFYDEHAREREAGSQYPLRDLRLSMDYMGMIIPDLLAMGDTGS